MAYLFNGSTDYLILAAPGTGQTPSQWSVACWLWWDAFSTDDKLFYEQYPYFVDHGWLILPNADSTFGSAFGFGMTGNVGHTYGHFTRPSAAAWHHYVWNFSMASGGDTLAAYVDGVSQTVSYDTGPSANTDTVTIDGGTFMSRSGSSLFGAGRIAELAIYCGVNLSANDAASLAKGYSPALIRPDKFKYYWPLLNAPLTTGDKQTQELIRGLDTGTNGTTSMTAHPSIIYPGAEADPEQLPITISVEDDITTSDTPNVRTAVMLLPSVSDSITTSNTATVALDAYPISVSSSIGVSESKTLLLTLNLSVEDDLGVAAPPVGVKLTTLEFNPSVEDDITASEAVTKVLERTLSVSESITTSDTPNFGALNLPISVTSSIAVSEMAAAQETSAAPPSVGSGMPFRWRFAPRGHDLRGSDPQRGY